MKLWEMDKLETDLKKIKFKNIGILGGSFDPPHKGHIKISTEAKKKYKLEMVIWAITKRNPLKRKSSLSLNKRILLCKKISSSYKYINTRYYEKLIKSNRTINLINYLKKKFTGCELYFIMGADNLISFHKWKQWREISSKCKILIFDRKGYKSSSLKSKSYKILGKKVINFIKFKKVNISSSQLRKI